MPVSRIDVGRRAAHDPLGDLQPRGADRELAVQPDRTRSRPASRRHRGWRGSAAGAPARPPAFRARRDRRQIDDRHEALAERRRNGSPSALPAPWAGRAARCGMKRRKNASTASRPSLVERSPRAQLHGRPAGSTGRAGRIVVTGAQRRQPLVAHQHQETGLRLVHGAAGSKPEGPFSIANRRSPGKYAPGFRLYPLRAFPGSAPSPDSGRSIRAAPWRRC